MIYFETLLSYYKFRWYKTKATTPMLTIPNQRHNSHALKTLKRQLNRWLKAGPNMESPVMQQALKTLIINFMNDVLGVETWVCDLLDHEHYYEVTQAFIQRANEEFPTMTFDDLFQALRNVWVLISLQLYMDCDLSLTDPVYAYSMLYPLTDNYLDDPRISNEDKRAFNQCFYKKILTGQCPPSNQQEEDIFRMIDLIYATYPHQAFPDLKDALLAILDGQNKSLGQQKLNTLYNLDLLEQTFYKGGSSVLADAYLIKGSLTDNQAQFAYGYGLLLQLADDLQDIETDLKDQVSTMMNVQALHSNLDGLTEKYMAFIDAFFDEIYASTSTKQMALKQLLQSSVELLLYSAITEHPNHFSKAFLKNYMKKSRFSKKSFNFLNNRLKKSIQSQL